MSVNGATRSSQNANSKDGKDWTYWTELHTCSHSPTTIPLNTTNPLKWQKSTNNGQTWSDIACTSAFYTESDPSAGHFIYRAQNGNGSYSDNVEVTYYDAVPATINSLPLTETTKTVDESITFSLELIDDNYAYQWYKNNAAIAGATAATYSIAVVKMADAAAYKCRVSNGCNTTDSEISTLTVNKSPQVITFPEIPVKTYGDAALTLPAVTDKGLAITYQSTNSNVATVSGNTLTIRNPGTSNIIASQAGNVDYLLATTVERSLTVNKQNQVITFDPLPAKRYGDPTFTLPATTDKGLTISYQSLNTNVASVSGNTVTIINAGTTDIIATQTGDTYRYAATPVSRELTVNKALQSISFAAFDTKTYGDANIVLNQYSDAGLLISYTSNNENVATITGNTVVLHNVGTAQITANQSGNSNYGAASTITRSLSIIKANQTIVWDNIPPKTYGNADFTLPQSSDKALTISYVSDNVNVATVSGNRVSITGAGNANITATQSGNSNYNAASSVTLPLTVSKAIQTITFAPLAEHTYGGSTFTLNASSNSGLPIVYESSNPAVASVSGNVVTILTAGETYIIASAAGNNNYYTATPQQQLLRVGRAAQTISLDIIAGKTYGDASFTLNAQVNTALPITYTSSNPAKLFISGNQAMILGAGTFTVTATQGGNSNYLPVSDSKTFTVGKANLAIAADNKARTYGGVNPALTYTTNGFVNGDSRADLQTLPVITCAATATSPTGEYNIVISGAADANYSFIYQNAKLTVNKAPLTVKANNINRAYGVANPTLTLSYTGFQNGETASVLSELPVAVTNARTTSNVGSYDIFVGGGSATNYELAYQNGTLTIGKAVINVIPDNKTRFYGDANPAFTFNYSGFVNEDTEDVLTSLPALTCSATLTSNVGNYAITPSGAAAQNYNFNYQQGILTVQKRNLQVIPDNKSRIYGDANPALTLSYVGFVNVNTVAVITTQPQAATSATISSNVGDYSITCSGGNATNYSFTYETGTLNITKAALSITANNASRNYGAGNPTFTLSYSGFKNGNTQSSLSPQPQITTTATATSAVGAYPLTVSGGTAVNYELSYIDGTLTINKASVTVKANSLSMTYGDNTPQYTCNYTGFANGETASVLSVLPTFSCNATSYSNTGSYTITPSGAQAQNYSFAYQSGTLTIGKSPLAISVQNEQRIVGTSNPAFTLLFSGFKNSENQNVLDQLPAVSCTANINSPVGFYDIILSGGSDNNYNYQLINGTLEVVNANGINEILTNNLSVYPNPVSNGELKIESAELTDGETITITDLSGRVVLVETWHSTSLQNGITTINVQNLLSGVYLLRVGNKVAKIVVEK
jgi:hypothetical protein